LSSVNNPASTFPQWRVAALLACLAALAGCATRADLQQVKQDQRETRALLADQQVAIEGLRRRVEIIRGELGESGRGRAGAPASSEVTQRLNDLEARLAALDQARAAGSPDATPPPAVRNPGSEEQPRPVEAPTPAAPKSQSQQEIALGKEEGALQGAHVDADYREGMGLIRQKNCGQAVPKLRDFIRKNPKSDLADNAQYWIGSCYYEQRDYNRAIIELNEVLLKYPKADKVPAALIMLADAFADSGDKIDARLILQKLISDHPKSEEADRGRQKLQALGQ
jgi:tol-pal system protein YbgF